MMRYVLLIYVDERVHMEMSPDHLGALQAAYGAFNGEHRDAIHGAEALQSVTTATSVRVRAGKPLITDGPFAETKEQLGGFYLVTCADLDVAVAIAAQIPDAERGTVEIRPVMELGAT